MAIFKERSAALPLNPYGDSFEIIVKDHAECAAMAKMMK